MRSCGSQLFLDDHKYGRPLKRFTVSMQQSRAIRSPSREPPRPPDFYGQTVDLVPHFEGEALEGHDDNFGAARCATARNASCAGLTRASIDLHKKHFFEGIDGRIKSGHDAGRAPSTHFS